jgi:hypothetical protein
MESNENGGREAPIPDEIELELATVEYDYRVHPEAMERIRAAFRRYPVAVYWALRDPRGG